MVERAAIAAVETEAMDEAGFEVADEELLGGGVVGDGAEAGTGIVLAVMLDVGEQRDEAGGAVDLPHRARRAAFAELARHPAGAWLALDQAIAVRGDNLQAEQRSRGDIDVGRRIGVVAVQRHAECLADLAGRRLKLDRGVGDLSLRRAAERGQVEHLKRGAIDIDEGEVERMEIGRHLANLPRAGERRDRRVAARHDRAVLRPRAKRQGKDRSEAEKSGAEPSRRREDRAIAHERPLPRVLGCERCQPAAAADYTLRSLVRAGKAGAWGDRHGGSPGNRWARLSDPLVAPTPNEVHGGICGRRRSRVKTPDSSIGISVRRLARA